MYYVIAFFSPAAFKVKELPMQYNVLWMALSKECLQSTAENFADI